MCVPFSCGARPRALTPRRAERVSGFPRSLAGVLLILGLALLTACASAPRKAGPVAFRVMTYNIHHGEGLDGRVDLERIAELIRAQQADIVALQEVDRGVQRTGRRDFPAELAALTGLTCVFSNNFAFQGGEYGNAVLTRFPVVRWTNTHLRMLRPAEQRGVLQLVLEVHGRELLFLNTHIDYRPDDAERLANVAQFREVLAQYPGLPAVFAGDFNDTPGSRTHHAMSEHWTDVWASAGAGDGFTIPSQAPNKRIDYLWIRKDAPLRAVHAWVPTSTASDHLPVVADFTWPRRVD
ncbi:MAG: endonuclease/exonuclease/phosphatase family protein [Verrucomicrobia bacterium]|nr:endonuclease/exonuclease/phosphatase family protein [Verrucomicrobiota bacterium]